jgi:DNA-binding CsgD family transcriptional regulator
MDQFNNRPADGRLDAFLSALENGMIFVDSGGQIAWMDEATRRSVNGGLQHVSREINAGALRGLRCKLSIVDVEMQGSGKTLCIIQETPDVTESGRDIVAAIEAVMADSSWFTQTIIDKVRAWRQVRQPSNPAGELDLLTDREREILALICDGRSDADMSKILNLSQNTVRNHVASLYRKIGVNRRSAAIIWARERALTRYEFTAAKNRHHSGRGQGY